MRNAERVCVNDQLLAVYERQWLSLRHELAAADSSAYTNPFLLSVDESKLRDAERVVMIFGQETKGWGAQIYEDVAGCVGHYHKFYCDEEFYAGYGRSAFWKAFSFFQRECARVLGDTTHFVWNNISKIGRPHGQTGVDDSIREIERRCFAVIAEEVQIIQPNFIVFMTGPNRDHDIRFHFTEAQFDVIGDSHKRQLARVSVPSTSWDAVRCYHPAYFGGFGRIKQACVSALLSGHTHG